MIFRKMKKDFFWIYELDAEVLIPKGQLIKVLNLYFWDKDFLDMEVRIGDRVFTVHIAYNMTSPLEGDEKKLFEVLFGR